MLTNEQRIQAITARLQSLNPTQLTIIDDSDKHIGHEGAKSGRGHFTVEIAAEAFAGQSKIASHRLIYSALGNLMQTEIHALAIKILE